MYYGVKFPACLPAQTDLECVLLGNILPSSAGVVYDESGNGNDAQLVNSNCLDILAGTELLYVTDLVGTETVVSSGGTSTPTISAGFISFTIGTCWDLVLSSGHIFPLAEGENLHCYNKGTGEHGTLSTATVRGTTDGYHANFNNGFSEALFCQTSGKSNIESNNAYGVWVFDFIKQPGTVWSTSFISEDTESWPLDSDRYNFISLATNSLTFNRGANKSIMMYTVNNYIENNVPYSVKIIRLLDGEFQFLIKGGAFGSEYVMIEADFGTNPSAPDNTYTTSVYSVQDLDAGQSLLRMKRNIYQGMALGDSTIAARNGFNSIADYLNQSFDFSCDSIATSSDTILGQTSKWNALSSTIKSNLDYVVVEIGLNDNLADISVTLANYQILIDTIRADIKTGAKIVGSCVLLIKDAWISLFGETLGLEYYNKMLALNNAIMGISNTITDLDYRNNKHLYELSTSEGSLKAEYDVGDGVHPNGDGRLLIAQSWVDTLTSEDFGTLENIRLSTLNIDTVTYQPQFTPAKTATIDALDNEITNIAVVGHNGAETKINLPDTLKAVVDGDITDPLGYADFLAQYGLSAISNTEVNKKRQLCFWDRDLTAEETAKALKCIKMNIWNDLQIWNDDNLWTD